MGFFSWLTADTDESIANVYSDREVKTVYLLQPNNLPPIEEPAYEGSGTFGGTDVYAWLAKMNFGDESLVSLAITADCGHYHEDADAIYLCSLHIPPEMEAPFRKVTGAAEKPIVFFETYERPIETRGGRTMNQLVEAKAVERKTIALKYPLKFSFNPKARYEDLPASESCPEQGYFYE